ncbi:hypothetical protein [Clostridium sp. B9]|uniref:hypothetical protein n=1 Tax=Clostridium sp. B9 TaxID=3423224 RepID=UPI003D2EF56B
MEIKKGEFEKLYRNPVLIVLIGIFLAYNMLIMYNNSSIREPLKLTNELIREVGYKVDDNMLNELDIKYKAGMKELNKITEEKLNKSYNSLDDFLESREFSQNIYSNEFFSKEDKDFFNRLSIINMYKNIAPNAISAIENMDVNKLADKAISMYGLEGKAAEFTRENYREFDVRLKELIRNGEHKNLYFWGLNYRTQNLLFGDVIGSSIIEIMIIIVLGVSFLINYERENKTLGLVTASKRGRRLLGDKLQVSLVFSVLVTAVILGVTLITYFNVFDYSEVWNVPISSAFNVGMSGPFLSWYNLTIREYLMLSVGVVFAIGILSAGLTFVLCSLLKSSYKSFFAFFILFGAFFMSPGLFPSDSIFAIWANFNMFVLSLNPEWWFMDAGVFIGTKHYVDITLVSNFIVVVLLIVFSMKLFKRENIKG